MNYVVVSSGCPPSGGAGNGNGNGDGMIDKSSGSASDGTWRCEPIQAIKSLNQSGMLPVDMTTPCLPSLLVYFKGINESCAYFYNDDLYNQVTATKSNTISWAVIPPASFSPLAPALSPMQARLIDEKIDDGIPNKGKFRGLNASLPSGGGIVANSCSTSGVYNINENPTCRTLYYLK